MPATPAHSVIETASSTHGVHLLIQGRWVCLEKGLSLSQAKAEAGLIHRRSGLAVEIRERNGAVVQRWEPRPDEAGRSHSAIRIVSSSEILQGAPEILIEHRQTIYRLRTAAGGKLILQK